MNYQNYISELLFENDCVILPEFGGFIANYSPAKIHPVHHTFVAPSKEIAFNLSLKSNDGLLAKHVAQSLSISYIEANQLVLKYVEECKQKLYSEKKLNFEKIGTLTIDSQNKIVFTAENSVNFLLDSFGLEDFVSPAIKRDDIQQRLEKKFKDRVVVQKTEKRRYKKLYWTAGITLPLAGLIIWGAFNMDTVNDLSKNYTSFVPSFFKSKTEAPVKKSNPIKAEELKVVPKTLETKTEVKTEENSPKTEVKETTSNIESFFIIGGCFKIEQNALNLIEQLKGKGFDAKLVGQNNDGLYRVAYSGFTDKSAAESELSKIKSSDNPGAWIMKK
jgi:hypothetical protein